MLAKIDGRSLQSQQTRNLQAFKGVCEPQGLSMWRLEVPTDCTAANFVRTCKTVVKDFCDPADLGADA